MYMVFFHQIVFQTEKNTMLAYNITYTTQYYMVAHYAPAMIRPWHDKSQ
jgi:hypothetical protein